MSKFVKIDGNELGLFAIYDGHLGERVPAYLQKHLFSNILKEVCVYINAGMKDTTWLFVLQNIRLHSLEVLVEDKVEEPKIWY